MSKIKKCNRTSIGGQAVLEGVMMRGASSMCTSVRDEEGNIRTETQRLEPIKNKPLIFRIPIIRGVINFFSSMITGSKTLMRSAEVFGEAEPSKFEKWLSKHLKVNIISVVTTLSLILGLGLAIFLFIWLPQFLTGLIAKPLNLEVTSIWFNLIEGLIKMLVFTAYILLTSLMKDIKRTFMYHGAEHKTINCYEYGLPLTVENVKKCSRIHDRCGTTFMFFVMFVSIIVFSLVNSVVLAEKFYRVLLKIALLPVVAGLSYELLKGLAKTDCPIFLPLKAPGMLLQMITTKEPDDSMIEVAINSFNTVLKMDADPTIPPQKFVTSLTCDKLLQKVKDILKEGNILDESDSEWIVSIASGLKRSEVVASTASFAPSVVEKATKWANERKTGKPLWYIIGDTEFYGYKIKVDENVLIPRPETEEVVAKALEFIDSGKTVLDLCTGGGAIAIAIQKESGAKVTASDISQEAINVATKNANLNGADITFIVSDLFSNIDQKFDVIVSNPPYLSKEDMDNLQLEVTFEPKLALYGGEDGYAVYRLIAQHFTNYLNENGKLILECGINQAENICQMFSGFTTSIYKDLNGVERIVVVQI